MIDEGAHSALIKVEDDQLSLAIGRSGQNVRLASKLTGWNIEVEKNVMLAAKKPVEENEESPETKDQEVEKQEETKAEIADADMMDVPAEALEEKVEASVEEEKPVDAQEPGTAES